MNKLLAIMFSLVCSVAHASNIELVVPWSPGGTTDKVAQLILTHARPEFAKHNLALNIVYKPGAGSLVGTNAVAAAPAGAMQILVAGNTLVSTPIITPTVANYNVTKDFVMLGYIGHVSIHIASNQMGVLLGLLCLPEYTCEHRRIHEDLVLEFLQKDMCYHLCNHIEFSCRQA